MSTYWPIADLVHRVKQHDWCTQDYQIMGTVQELGLTGRVNAIGRRCDLADEPSDRWEPIPAHEWADLVIEGRRRREPHYSGDVYWRSSGRRGWAFVQFSEGDLLREWMADVFTQPRREWIADVVVPPPPKSKPTTDPKRPSQIETNQWMVRRAERELVEKGRLKQRTGVEDCMSETGASWRVAINAHRSLPDKYRYYVGRAKIKH
jgi:hypothetical protein